MENNPFIDPSLPLYKPERRLSSRIAILVVGIILVVALLFGVSKYLNSKPQKSKVASIVPTIVPTEVVTPTVVASPSPTLKPSKVSPTPTSPASSSLDKVTGLDRKNLDIAIENGSGVVGAAGKVSTVLKNLGYNIVSTGNADEFTYQNITIQVKPASSKYLSLLKKDLSGNYTIGSATSDLAATSTADAIIIVGK